MSDASVSAVTPKRQFISEKNVREGSISKETWYP